jgi:hypothetical protein
MSPETLLLVVSLVEQAMAEAPAFSADLQSLFANGTPTAADFAALRAKIAGETYGQFVPASQLPKSETNT